MDVKNMTVRDFLEYAELYPYTEDRYTIEKELMELNLLEMHLETYNFIINNDLNGDHLDTLMVESGMNDVSYHESQLYIEKADIITKSLKKLINIIAKAIKTSMAGFAKMFSIKHTTLTKYADKEKKIINGIENGTTLKMQNLPDDIKNRIEELHNRFSEEYHKYYGSNIALKISIGIAKDNNIFKIEKAINSNLNPHILETMVTLCNEEFTVTGLKYIAYFEDIIDEFKNLFNQFNNILTNANTPQEFIQNITKLNANMTKVHNNLEIQTRTNTTFKISEKSFIVKRDKAFELEEMELVDFSKFGKPDNKVAATLKDAHNSLETLHKISSNTIQLLSSLMNLSKLAYDTHVKIVSVLYEYITSDNNAE